jgi:hypothetical protein
LAIINSPKIESKEKLVFLFEFCVTPFILVFPLDREREKEREREKGEREKEREGGETGREEDREREGDR